METQLFIEDSFDYSKENIHNLLSTHQGRSQGAPAVTRPFRDITHKFVTKDIGKKKSKGCGNLLKSNLGQHTGHKTLLRAWFQFIAVLMLLVPLNMKRRIKWALMKT